MIIRRGVSERSIMEGRRGRMGIRKKDQLIPRRQRQDKKKKERRRREKERER